jgi:hypothetical protein
MISQDRICHAYRSIIPTRPVLSEQQIGSFIQLGGSSLKLQVEPIRVSLRTGRVGMMDNPLYA